MKKSLIIGLGILNVISVAAEKPNIVLILADDMGWGDVGYHGFKDILTPNIDRLAKEGTWFSQGYASASVCGPSRAGLLTGVYQQRMGVYGNWDRGGIPESQPIIFEMLKKLGYQTCAIGKWHVGACRESLRPNSRAVDFFYGFLWGAHDYWRSGTDPEIPKKNERPIWRNTSIEPSIQDSNGYLTELFTKEAVDFIERADKNKPFFVYLAYNAVHSPWEVPQSYIDRVQGLNAPEERKFFAGMVLALDDGIGAVIKALEKKGMAGNTLVVFMSDNGTPRGQGLTPPKQKTRGQCTMSNPGPFNGFKGDTYEGGIRIPMLAWWPGKIPAGQRYDQPVISLDWVATFMALHGIDQPYKGLSFDGVNLMPYITGKKTGRPHEVLYWRRGDDYAVRKGDWKLTWNDQSGPQTIRLFNLAEDPGEWRDLAAANPERAQMLQNLFDAWDSRLPDNQNGKNPKNRNTGYAAGRRIHVTAFNAAISATRTDEKKNRKRTREKGRAGSPKGITLKEKLAQAKAHAEKTGKKFDPKRTIRFFRAKDRNGDGMIDAKEAATKVAPGWNKQVRDASIKK